MRTTITLDDDVTALLRRIQKQRRLRFKEVVNQALREGLTRMEAERKSSTPFRTGTFDGGRCLIGNLDCISEAMAIAEGEDYR